ALLLLLGTACATRGWPLARRARRLMPWWRPALTLVGLGSLALALVSPLDALAHRHFAAHMVQHMLLVAVAAPALLLADPFAGLLWALPARTRVRAGRLLVRGAPVRRVWQTLTRAPVAWLAYALVLWGWHLPGTLGPLEDQALGGVVMWAVGGAVDMLAVILLLYRFFTSDSAR